MAHRGICTRHANLCKPGETMSEIWPILFEMNKGNTRKLHEYLHVSVHNKLYFPKITSDGYFTDESHVLDSLFVSDCGLPEWPLLLLWQHNRKTQCLQGKSYSFLFCYLCKCRGVLCWFENGASLRYQVVDVCSTHVYWSSVHYTKKLRI